MVDTSDLVECRVQKSQTKVSFAVGTFVNFLSTQRELIEVNNKIQFSNALFNELSLNVNARYVRNPRMERILKGEGHTLIYIDMPEEERSRALIKEIFENYAYEAKKRIELKREL